MKRFHLLLGLAGLALLFYLAFAIAMPPVEIVKSASMAPICVMDNNTQGFCYE